MSVTSGVTDVAVAVLRKPDGQFLLGQRPRDKSWAGWWEFPGGKIEPGESALQGLQRELQEELGISSVVATPWLVRRFTYPEGTVNLRFFTVRHWSGEPRGREGQALTWQRPAQLSVGPVLPANEPILKALQLPVVYAISNLAETPETLFLRQLQHSLDQGLRLIQIREKQLDASALRAFSLRVVALAHTCGAIVMLNGDCSNGQDLIGADGVHLTARQLMEAQERPQHEWVAASCHNAQELQRAQELGVDFVTLSPILSTRSHPQLASLGWQQLETLVADYTLPVMALGGLQMTDLPAAWQHGAHGIAMQRAVWTS